MILSREQSQLMREYNLLLNQIAQNVHPIEDALSILRESPEQNLFWQVLRTMITQSHPTKEEAYLAIENSGLKPTYTPCVLIIKGNTPERNLHQVCGLPEYEHEKVITLLLHLFRIADLRRRTISCSEGCSHWWHLDLSDLDIPYVVE